jgi:TorA maturation chaperone TorD
MASARSGLYEFLAGMCARPTGKMVEAIAGGSFDALLPLEGGKALPEDLKSAMESLRSYRPTGVPSNDPETELAVDWTRLFRGVRKGYSPPPPYESVYKVGALQGEITRSVEEIYRRYGVSAGTSAGELPDHISLELMFISVLAKKELEAWDGKREEAIQLLKAQSSFLKEHLLSWVPKFCSEAEKLATTTFYKGLMKLIPGLLRWDASLVNGLKDTAILSE